MASLHAIQDILDACEPLDAPRGVRLPLLVWTLTDLEGAGEEEARGAIRELDARGMALITSWRYAAPAGARGSIEASLAVARTQRDLGIETCVNANDLLHRFCDGSPETAHVDDRGEPFFDFSFDSSVPMGCPFALEGREPEIRSRVEAFADAHVAARLHPTFVFADWEIDGALEWNGAWEASRRCRRCRQAVGDVEDFAAFQLAVRRVRSRLQRACFAEPLTSRFPGVLVGNYGVYPHGGVRTWYDYFEQAPALLPSWVQPGPGMRAWAHEFPWTGYGAAMPVVYPWSRSWSWSNVTPPDLRWAHILLAEATIAGTHTPAGVPIVPFVHWKPVVEPRVGIADCVPLSETAYREILWHILLRGAATLFLWCPAGDTSAELPPVHAVYRESLRHADILAGGRPVRLDLPPAPAPITSAMERSGRRVDRTTDFARLPGP